ncbi:VOC family protein [Labrys monachus]|uniref:Glyoxalase family protein n=1 Tax=Labrys monachus TaxID=217067 RepID=A0ABU0FHI8_9HYPH|nr:VOC family protein [Labrys monachus]MDQ0394077.1 glyoxalase family protein [Labrys monachus]
MTTTTRSGAEGAGIHHITAITGDGRANIRFYRDVLGLRLVKRTVNFDDPTAHHLYFGDATGKPGTILTFFAWAGAHRGKPGTGEAQTIAFRVPEASLDWWRTHLGELGIPFAAERRFGEELVALTDPDGICLELVAAGPSDPDAWVDSAVPPVHAVTGFHGVTLHVGPGEGTARVLSDVLGFAGTKEDGDRRRFSTGSDTVGGHVDVVVDAKRVPSSMGAGSIHHVAFRAADDAAQAAMAEALQEMRVGTTEQKDRTYFRSIYFREPGGVIFEIATDAPGFAIDESVETLGTALKLPPQYEAYRGKIEAALPDID